MPEKRVPLPTGPVEQEIDVQDEDGDYEVTGSPSDRNETSTDPLNDAKPFTMAFTPLLMDVIGANYRAFFPRLKRHMIWLIPLFIVWIVFWTVPDMTWYSMPSIFRSLGMVVIFLTATYNGFIGKAVFLTIISRTVIPWINDIRNHKGGQIISRLKRVHSLIHRVIKSGKEQAMGLFVISAGLGIFISNILTRNNKPDKYLVCLMLGIAILDDLSKGRKNIVLQLVTAMVRDTRKFVKIQATTTIRSGYAAASGFALGVTLAFLPGLFAQSYTSKVGMVMGSVVAIAGFVMLQADKKTSGGSGADETK